MQAAGLRKYPLAGIDGFTMIELVVVIMLAAILAAVAMPRFIDRGAFDADGFTDQLKATLRHAQKLAIAKRHFVCVSLSAGDVTLTYDPVDLGPAKLAASCPGSALTSPNGDASYVVTAPTGVVMVASVAAFNFDALGRPNAGQSIQLQLNGVTAHTISVEAETGYVHEN